MEEHFIKTQKTGRYFSLGNLNKETKYVWIVLHGYGYHARYFIKKFEAVLNNETYIIAPEALNRFYKDGMTGKVGASWMTKEDRLHEIEDYINYLNNLYDTIFENIERSNVQLVTVGFSQGGATMIRWLNNRHTNTDKLVLWGSKIPDDFFFSKHKDLFDNSNNYFLLGESDQFLEYINIDHYKTILQQNQIEIKLIWYKGGHDITTEALVDLNKSILNFPSNS